MADPTLNIRISGDISAIRESIATLQRDFTSLGQQVVKSGNVGAAAMTKLERSVSGVQNTIKGLLTSFALLQSFKAVVGFADEFLRLNGQLKLATKSAEEFAIAQKGVFDIAQRTRASVGETANTYAALQRTTSSLGLSQGELLRVLETVNKSIALTPVNAQTAASTLVQFGQALGGNFKNGSQELNSIMEQTPGLAVSIAKGLGVEVSALKQMGEQGKLSTELVVRGLLRIGDEVDEKFKQVPTTVSGAIEQVKNDLLFTLGRADISPLIESFNELRRLVQDPNIVSGLIAIANGMLTVAGAAVKAAAEVANFAKFIGEDLAAAISGPGAQDIVRLDQSIQALKKHLAGVQATSKFDPLNLFQGGKEARVAKIISDLQELQKQYDLAMKAADEAANAERRKSQADAAAGKTAGEKAEADFKAAQAAQAQQARDDEAAKAAEARQKEIKKTIDSIVEEAATYGKTADQVVRYRLSVLGATEAQIKQAEAAGQRLEQLKKEEDATKERKKAEEDLGKALLEAGNKLVGLQQGDAAKALLELQQKRDELLKQLATLRPQDASAVSLVNKLFDVESAQIRSKQIEEEAARLIKSIQEKEQSISAQVSAGIISQAVGDQQLRGARQETIDLLVKQRDALIELYKVQPSQETIDAVSELNKNIGELATRNMTGLERAIVNLRAQLAQMQQDFAGDTITALTDSLTNFFESILTGSKSAKDALLDFVRGFAQAMLQIAARALATFLVLRLLDAIYPGLGKATAAAMGAGVHHTGGIAGQASTTRMVNPMLFAAAPRYHMGGVAGLAPNEVPAILQKGEEVIPKSDPRHAMNAGSNWGQQAGNGTRVLNIFDESFVPDQMNSAAGEKVILNVIGKNPGRVKTLLGGA